MRRLFILALVGLAVPPLFAARELQRRERAGIAPFDPAADEIDLAAIFDGLEARSTAASFRGGDVLAWYGGGILDLRDATLDPAGAHLRVRSIFGGLDIVVPEGWRVKVQGRSILGGTSDMTRRPDAGAVGDAARPGPVLVVDALSVFGGASIRSVRPSTGEALAGTA